MSGNDQLVVGKTFTVTIHNGKKDSTFKAITLSKNDNNSFSARQTIIGKWFFSATHFFIIEESDHSEEQVTFIQKWHLTGLVSNIFKKQIFKELELFNQMNEELKTYLENGDKQNMKDN